MEEQILFTFDTGLPMTICTILSLVTVSLRDYL